MSLSMMEDGDLVPTWRLLMKYPDLIPHMKSEVMEILDTLQELFPIKFYRTKLDTFLMWYSKGRATGIVNLQEDINVKQEMIHGSGGM
jgi:ribosome maturation protein Sdo1